MVYPLGGSRSAKCTLPLNRPDIGPTFTAAVACMSLSDSLSSVSQPGMLAFSTAGSLSACQTAWRGAAMRRSPVMSIRPNPVVRGGRYLQGPGHATDRTRAGLGPAVRWPAGFYGRLPDRRAAVLAPVDVAGRTVLEHGAGDCPGRGAGRARRICGGLARDGGRIPAIRDAATGAVRRRWRGAAARRIGWHCARQYRDAGIGYGDGRGDGDDGRLHGADPSVAPGERASAEEGAPGAVPDRAGGQRIGRADASWQSAAIYRPAAWRPVLLAGAASGAASAAPVRLSARWLLPDRSASGGVRASAHGARGALPPARHREPSADPAGGHQRTRATTAAFNQRHSAGRAYRPCADGLDRSVPDGDSGLGGPHATRDPPGERLLLGADGRSGDLVRCHLRHHWAGLRNPAGRAERSACRICQVQPWQWRRALAVRLFLADRAVVGVA